MAFPLCKSRYDYDYYIINSHSISYHVLALTIVVSSTTCFGWLVMGVECRAFTTPDCSLHLALGLQLGPQVGKFTNLGVVF